MAAIQQRFKPRIKAFVSDLIKEINKKCTFVDIIIHPKSIPFGDTTSTVINYCDELEQPSYSPIQVRQY